MDVNILSSLLRPAALLAMAAGLAVSLRRQARRTAIVQAEQAHAQHTGPDGRVLQDQEVADVTAFARTGDPSAADTLLWPEFNSSGEVMSLNVGGDSQVGTSGQIALDHHCGFWDQIAPRP